jgi:hypothetical protein
MFAHLSQSFVLRAAALLPITANSTVLTSTNNLQRGMGYLITCAARTVGTVTVTLQQSFDGGTTWKDTSETASVTGNGTFEIKINRPVTSPLRLRFVPAGGFDGTIAAEVRSNTLITQ